MTCYGNPIDQNTMMAIASYMDDDIREEVHALLAPCTHEEFMVKYLELDPEFETLLRNEFAFDW